MQHISVRKENNIATITFERAEKFNSFIRSMALDFHSVLDEVAADESVRCIIITGSGKAFCAGQDLQEATDPEGPALSKIVSEHYNPAILRIRNIPKPVIAAVNGVAAGAGASDTISYAPMSGCTSRRLLSKSIGDEFTRLPALIHKLVAIK